MTNKEEVKKIVKSSIGTKFIKKWFVALFSYFHLPHLPPILSPPLPLLLFLSVPSSRSDLACDMALSAVETVAMESGDRKEIDIKRYAKVEKV